MRICVYCSSSSEIAPLYLQTARELGRLIGTRGHWLVYGGANLGLMRELAQAVKAAGGRVTGIIPRRLQEGGLAYEEADDMIVTNTISERKALMEQRGEAFVALPGGFGTLEELLQAIALKQVGCLRAPIVLLNVEGFYDALLAHFEQLYVQRFAQAEQRRPYHVAENALQALRYIEDYAPSRLPGERS